MLSYSVLVLERCGAVTGTLYQAAHGWYLLVALSNLGQIRSCDVAPGDSSLERQSCLPDKLPMADALGEVWELAESI